MSSWLRSFDWRSLLIEQHTVPPVHYVEMNIKLIDHPHRHVIDHVVETLRMIIESRHWRKYDDAHSRQLQHVFEMYFVQRRLAYDEHQFTSFFENHVGGAMNEIVADITSSYEVAPDRATISVQRIVDNFQSYKLVGAP